MPNYDYTCMECDTDEERNVSMEERESQWCNVCDNKLTRAWTFKGSVWSPTREGANHS